MSEIDVNKRDKTRFQFLHAVYEQTAGSERPTVDLWEIGKKLGLGGRESQETFDTYQWLHHEGLLVGRGLGGEIGITHQGIKEVEEAKKQPANPTEHFPPNIINIIQNFGTMSNTTIQQGSIGSTQTVNISQLQREEICKLVGDLDVFLRSHSLNEDQEEELQRQKSTLEFECKSKKPKIERVMEGLRSSKNTLDTIAVGATLAMKIGSLLSALGVHIT